MAGLEFVVNYASRSSPTFRSSKFTRLRGMLASPDTRFIMEAHSALSAKIVEEAGFEGIWASGLSMSAALGLRDNNELSWTQVLDQLEYMADATSIPILVDGDTGYGNFNNFRRLVRKLCQRGIAGVCIEDKVFPKTNSFLGDNQALADIDEFCGKIKAGKDNQEHEDFSVVARVEALISGRGMDEALRRAEAYADAGADAILIHSKKADPAEILEFCRLWDDRKPVVLVPTKYYRVPTARLREAKASLVIWANHNLRASIQAMRTLSKTLHEQQSLLEIEHEVASMEDIFALAGASELEEAEKRYLSDQPQTAAIILAATRGSNLGELTEDRPKCMVNVRGQSILERQLAAMQRNGIRNVTVVTGYRPEAVDVPGIRKVDNPAYASTGEARSLAAAKDALSGPCIVSFGDVVYRPFFLSLLKDRKEDFVILVDPAGREKAASGAGGDFVRCSAPFSGGLGGEDDATLTDIRDRLAEADGEWVGLLGLSAAGSRLLREELTRMEREGELDKADLAQALRNLMAQGRSVGVVYVSGNWMNINDLIDLAQARNEM
jgi:phosphoenolpyruvate phosphomutase